MTSVVFSLSVLFGYAQSILQFIVLILLVLALTKYLKS